MVLCQECNNEFGFNAYAAIKDCATWRESGPVIRSVGRSGDKK